MQKTHTYINALNEGMKIKDVYLARDITRLKTRRGSDYLRMTLHDRSGSLEAKLWEFDEDAWEENPLTSSELLAVHLEVESYAGKLQGRLLAYQKLESGSDKMLAHLVPTAPIDPVICYDELMRLVATFEHKELQQLVLAIWREQKEQILVLPASQQVHHAVRSGFLYHISRMAKAALRLAEVYDILDKDLLLTGVMLHDIGKFQEYDVDRFDMVSAYAKAGNLLGHITLGSTYVADVCRELGLSQETQTLVMHLILSHHNQPEWGSPVRPAVPEALALHHLDALDAHLYVFEETFENQEEGTFSAPVYFLERTKLYKMMQDPDALNMASASSEDSDAEEGDGFIKGEASPDAPTSLF